MLEPIPSRTARRLLSGFVGSSTRTQPSRVESNLRVSRALDAVRAFLERLKSQGKIARYKGPVLEGQALYVFTVYAPDPEAVEEEVWEGVIGIGRREKVTILADVEKDAQRERS